MKVLTIKEPWASLIINGYKEYEFRTWKTSYRGKLLIHAGMGIDKNEIKLFENYNLNYEHGAIIGEVNIVDCILIDETFDKELKSSNNLVYKKGNYVGIYAWKLENVIKYENPIYIKGKLSLWNYDN